jgi:hypothetical protein
VVHLVAIEEHDDVGGVLELAELAQVGELRPLVGASLEGAVRVATSDN